MGLLQDMQVSLLDENASLGAILLKLRFLADRLGSNVLEDWVTHETEGYPRDVEVPEYRKTSIVYTGTFSNGFQTLNRVGVSPFMIKKYGGDDWVNYSIYDSLPLIESMVQNTDYSNGFTLDTSDLKLLIQGKIYKGLSCIELTGLLDRGAFVRVLTSVRANLLSFTLALERRVPVASLIVIDKKTDVSAADTAAVATLTQNIFNAPVNQITSTGAGTAIQFSVIQGDTKSLESALASKGLSAPDAAELATIVSEEKPVEADRPGKRAAAWIADKAAKGAGAVWGLGIEAAKQVIAAEIKKYYGG